MNILYIICAVILCRVGVHKTVYTTFRRYLPLSVTISCALTDNPTKDHENTVWCYTALLTCLYYIIIMHIVSRPIDNATIPAEPQTG